MKEGKRGRMKSKCIELINLMMNSSTWSTASDLATLLNVSERSIKNYVSEINSYENGLITSSRNGYLLNTVSAQKLLKKNESKIPQNSKERMNFVITELLINEKKGAPYSDLFQLADRMHFSIDTILKDLSKIRRRLVEYDLTLSNTDYSVQIEGSERDKRKILSEILYDEFSDHIMKMSVIEKAFPDYDLQKLKSIILFYCDEYHYYINEYSQVNLLLDVVIAIERVKNDKTCVRARKTTISVGIREQEMVQKIAHQIEQEFDICYNDYELEELGVILLGHLMKVNYVELDEQKVKEVVGAQCTMIVDEIRNFLKKDYFVDTDNSDFLVKFTLHIKNLLRRLENGYLIKNPLTDQIKNSCPLIFECAFEVSELLKELTGYIISDSEIAYIAIHIGSSLEKQRAKQNVISCTILYPQYYDYSTQIVEKLKNYFQDKLEIANVITSTDELTTGCKSDLLVSTIDVKYQIRDEIVKITPFLNNRDFDLINNKIKEIQLQKRKAILKKHLLQISNPNLFFKDFEPSDQHEAITFMVKALEKEEYVDQNFLKEVLAREDKATTAFEHIAVPHAMKMMAKKTGMAVLINQKKSIPWAQNHVNIILLFAINEKDKELFHEVYDNLIVLLLDKTHISEVIRCGSYDEFIEKIVDCFE